METTSKKTLNVLSIDYDYFMKLKETPTLECLGEIFTNNIIPLLQEYFFDDAERIKNVIVNQCCLVLIVYRVIDVLQDFQ